MTKEDTVWKFDICDEFDCTIEYAKSCGADCKGDFTKKPCIFLGEHNELNLEPHEDYDDHTTNP